MKVIAMYKRKSLEKSSKTAKKEAEHNRKRSVIVNFRMSPQEKEMLDNRIKLSGLQKQNYMINSVLHQKIVTVGNIKTFEEIWTCLLDIQKNLNNSNIIIDDTKMSSVKTICEIISGLGNFEELSIDYERQLVSYKKKIHAINDL
jgi:predicted DNA binding CopG/RHH family protein